MIDQLEAMAPRPGSAAAVDAGAGAYDDAGSDGEGPADGGDDTATDPESLLAEALVRTVGRKIPVERPQGQVSLLVGGWRFLCGASLYLCEMFRIFR